MWQRLESNARLSLMFVALVVGAKANVPLLNLVWILTDTAVTTTLVTWTKPQHWVPWAYFSLVTALMVLPLVRLLVVHSVSSMTATYLYTIPSVALPLFIPRARKLFIPTLFAFLLVAFMIASMIIERHADGFIVSSLVLTYVLYMTRYLAV